MTAALGANLVELMPKSTVAEQESAFASCTFLASEGAIVRKVEPLFEAFGYDIWLKGLRRDSSRARNLTQEERNRLPDAARFARSAHLRNGR